MSRRKPRRSYREDMELLTKEIFNNQLRQARSICVLGHVSPDGDCIGSTLAVYNYILELKGAGEYTVQVYLEPINEKFMFLNGASLISDDSGDGKSYELAVVCDVADTDRLGRFEKYLKHADKALLIDHHFTNKGFGDYGIIKGEASSACEVLYDLLIEQHINKHIAECIYTGIIHDTGVLRYSSTSKHTMDIAGSCMAYGIDFGRIVEETFFTMSFEQKLMVGYILTHAKRRAEGRIIYSYIDMETRKAMHAEDMDMDGMIDQLRTTSGAYMAVYMYETKDGRVKASLRSNLDMVDVSRYCIKHSGGGHRKAAGCFVPHDFEKNMDEVEADFLEQIGNAAFS